MIVRGIRSQSRIKGDQHRHLERTLEQLRAENKQLRVDVLKLEQRLLESQQSKQKYKNKYREAKQKIEILQLVGLYTQRNNDPYDYCHSPKTKTTRVRTASEEQSHSLKAGRTHSELEQNFSTRPYLPEPDQYQIASKKAFTPATTIRQEPQEDPKILQSLMKVHEQLQKLSQHIEKVSVSPQVLSFETELYRKMEQVVDRISRMEVRDLQREKQRVLREKDRVSREKDRVAKRCNSSLKAVEQIGRNLLEFKVDE